MPAADREKFDAQRTNACPVLSSATSHFAETMFGVTIVISIAESGWVGIGLILVGLPSLSMTRSFSSHKSRRNFPAEY